MYTRVSTILLSVAAFAGLATAVPNALEVRDGGECNTGSIQCCTSVQSSSSTFISELFSVLSLPLPPSNTQVGFTCSPITVGGIGSGSACTQQPVCCNGNTFNGLITTGCSPTTINL